MINAALVAAAMAAAQPVPSALSALAAKAGLDRPVAAWCAGEFRSGRPGAYALAVADSAEGGRYLVIESDGGLLELGSFTGDPEVSCYSPAEARKVNATIRRSETIHGSVTPEYPTTVVCAFVEITNAVCWQYSPRKRAFVKIGGWVT